MPLQIISPSANVLDIDAIRNAYVRGAAPVDFVSGGGYSVTGWSTGVIAASLASTSVLVALRFSTGAATGKNAYLTRLRFQFSPVTVGASAGVPGTLAWQRFDAGPYAGGNSRLTAVFRKHAGVGGVTEMADIRDSNAALTTGSGPVLGTEILSGTHIPNSTGPMILEWVVDQDDMGGIPARLSAGQGLALVSKVAFPGTMTWMYSYTAHWYESTK